ncbi:hypothetical protein LK09_06210 [Microbacterium mangrovi]|uniref:HTH lacI-type domain-containing protein n=2 Tax=Microbacterium mangrovi TaxID=1348253 RepID=A0A0B2A659_9MICO|nr:hypothetical protein LK09_06210 [Microbacterium mangrovi]
MTDEGGAVTLADIAARAGTTVPTVSKVLNGRSDVSAEMRDRVLRILAETGYRRTRRRGSAAPPDLHLVDLVISGVEGSWANLVLSGVERAASGAGLDVVVMLARDVGPRSWLERLLARPSRGAVLALVSPTAGELAALRAAGIPIVLLDPVAAPAADVPSVGASNWAGGHAAGRHLLELGHRSFAVVAGPPGHLYSQARLDGFRSALAADGASLDASRVVHAGGGADDVAIGCLLDAADPPTAVFACTDPLALAVYRAAAERGIRIGRELSVVGFDDLPEAAWTTPALTTVRQPVADMGAAALRMLLRLRDDPETTAPREELATELVVRESAAAPLDVHAEGDLLPR